eukprot:5122029-Pyramimonas_sp.AAC.1
MPSRRLPSLRSFASFLTISADYDDNTYVNGESSSQPSSLMQTAKEEMLKSHTSRLLSARGTGPRRPDYR